MKRIIATLVMVAMSALAYSQAPTLTFTAQTTTGSGSVVPVLTWGTTPAATNCTASGHASWTGAKPASGTQTLPAITATGSYTLSLACAWPGDNKATVTWIAPTTNTDGSALAKCVDQLVDGPCLQKFHVYRRVGTPDMTNAQMTPVDDRNATSLLFPQLGVGTHYFAVEAVNGDGVPSELSNIVNKVITSSTGVTEQVTITVNPKPSPVSGLVVQ